MLNISLPLVCPGNCAAQYSGTTLWRNPRLPSQTRQSREKYAARSNGTVRWGNLTAQQIYAGLVEQYGRGIYACYNILLWSPDRLLGRLCYTFFAPTTDYYLDTGCSLLTIKLSRGWNLLIPLTIVLQVCLWTCALFTLLYMVSFLTGLHLPPIYGALADSSQFFSPLFGMVAETIHFSWSHGPRFLKLSSFFPVYQKFLQNRLFLPRICGARVDIASLAPPISGVAFQKFFLFWLSCSHIWRYVARTHSCTLFWNCEMCKCFRI